MTTIRRNFKNIVNNFSEAQVKVREATSNDPWGPPSSLMSEISDMTHNVMAYTEIMSMVWKRLNDKNKNWRHVYKALVLLDYLIKTGSEKVAQQCKENLFAIQSLRDFQFIEETKDHGLNVREKAKQLVNLLKDDEKLKSERTKALKAKERLQQSGSISSSSAIPTNSDYDSAGRSPSATGGAAGDSGGQADGDVQLELALAISKEEHDQELKRRQAEGEKEDLKLKMALEASKKEEETLAPLRMPPPAATGNSSERQRAGSNAAQQQQGSSLLDLFDTQQSTTQSAAASDPWAVNNNNASNSVNNNVNVQQNGSAWNDSDPFGASAAPAAAPAALDADFAWGDAAAPAASAAAAPTVSAETAFGSSDPWSGLSSAAPPPTVTMHGSANAIDAFNNTDDGFGQLMHGNNDQGNQLTPPAAADPWASSGSQGNLPLAVQQQQQQQQQQQKQPPRAKSAHDFLGEHGTLVDLDKLVIKPVGGSNGGANSSSINPFATGIGHTTGSSNNSTGNNINPFHSQANQPTLAQLQQKQQHYLDPSGGGGLPAPLIQSPQNSASNNPWAQQQQQQQQQQQSLNPFL